MTNSTRNTYDEVATQYFENHFDLIASHMVLNDVPDYRGFINTICTTLKSQGRAVFSLNKMVSFSIYYDTRVYKAIIRFPLRRQKNLRLYRRFFLYPLQISNDVYNMPYRSIGLDLVSFKLIQNIIHLLLQCSDCPCLFSNSNFEIRLIQVAFVRDLAIFSNSSASTVNSSLFFRIRCNCLSTESVERPACFFSPRFIVVSAISNPPLRMKVILIKL